MKIQSEEEWRKWYIDSYAPKEIIELYNMNYENIPVYTSIWKHLYNKNLENSNNVNVQRIKEQMQYNPYNLQFLGYKKII